MTADQLFYEGVWFWLFGWMAISLPLYTLVLWKSWKSALFYLGLVLLVDVYAAFYSVHGFGGAFGPGMVLSCLGALLFPISLILWVLLRHPFQQKFAGDLIRRRLYFWGGLLIVVLQFSPLAGSLAIDAACYRATRNNAQFIIQALRDYQQTKGVFPEHIETLQPDFIAEIPEPGCTWLRAQPDWPSAGFQIQTCSEGTVLLISESSDGTSLERYNFSTGNWSSVSFLDGACSYLR